MKRRHATVDLILLDESIKIDLDLGRILVCVNFEVTEVTTLPAERDVNIKTERMLNSRRLVERVEDVGNILGLPLREWWVVRDKIVSYFGSGLSDLYGHGINQISIVIGVCQLTISYEPFGVLRPLRVSCLRRFLTQRNAEIRRDR